MSAELDELSAIIGGKLITRSSMKETAAAVLDAGYRKAGTADEETVERVAKALCAAEFPEVSPVYAWNVQFEDGQNHYRKMARAALAASPVAPDLGLVGGLREAADIVASEEREQWRLAERHSPCAQVVAQRMQIVAKVIRSRAEDRSAETRNSD